MSCYNIFLPLLVSSFLLFTFLPGAAHGSKKCYIVYLGAHSHGPTPTSLDLETATYSHYDLLGSVLGSHEKAKEAMIYSYNKHINGFAALLDEDEAAIIAENPNVVSVFVTKKHKLHTTRSWEFLGLHRNDKNSAWPKGRFGENTIIANIDTGVWPESTSFDDTGYGPIPSKWRGGNVCQINNFQSPRKKHCNRKLIGARFFIGTFEAYYGKLDEKLKTARDFVGHGTHTLSTAGGNFVEGASVFAVGNGTAKGGSPRARVAAYKVCWSLQDASDCFGGDILSAIDQAINDGVDIISISIGDQYLVHPEDIFTDEISIGSFHAISNNILFVASGGNDGPTPRTVANVAPWIFTVAASTTDRNFSSTITFGNGQQITGATLFVDLPPNHAFPVILAADGKLANATTRDASLCRQGTLDPAKVRGKIVDCLREGKIKSVSEGLEALKAGARAILLENQEQNGETTLAEPHIMTGVSSPPLTKKDVKKEKPPGPGFHDAAANDISITLPTTIMFSPVHTFFNIKPAPVMASFSSRGPSQIQPSILKPDITAPGTNILAAYSLFASASDILVDGRRGFRFNVLQGTSMSCPHITGVAGLLKTLHPHWSPAAIKSAIMTTATTLDNSNGPIKDAFDDKLANSFAYGSGHVRPNLAIDPGLVYDLHLDDYLNFLCASGYNQQAISALNFNRTFTCKGNHSIDDLNYPSITLPNLKLSPETVTRTLTNVGPPGTYNVTAKVDGCKITVVPNSLTFTKLNEKKTFKVTVQASSVIQSYKYQFGELIWTDGKHRVRSPITIRRRK
ncbi:subtilisin-like protease Glyma18g48580 [Arachis hypogaea]|uniref:Subtilisin-like protease n=1 Tax=Arachis hypogaea TaxID=3818 RepID=A0A445DC98_ARAHY|nr:subtilisin-like protease Glyma18g48580 [Arachis hypogaea]QHO39948.1 Subtilisin-like protease [Arachis hypogaea]RYR60775.1 hypothetical protein Ahy_A04g017838 isoform A [Arachis hypogaea]